METANSLGLSLSRFDAKLSDVELAAAPPVGPTEDGVLLPAQLDDHQLADVHVGGDEEGHGVVAAQFWPAEMSGERRRSRPLARWIVFSVFEM